MNEERRPTNILLVQDDPDDVRLIQHELKRMGGPQLTVAASAAHAMVFLESLARFPRATPNLILLGVNPADPAGMAVLRYTKSQAKLSSIPAVVISAARDREAVAEAYDLGANCCIVKSDTPDLWERSIDMMCRFWLEFARLPGRR